LVGWSSLDLLLGMVASGRDVEEINAMVEKNRGESAGIF
jgi:hypothetical protein